MLGGRSLKLAVVGTAGGIFSGLFGVGGGAVMVPLMVLWLDFDERRATATSLGAIALIAAAGAAVQGAYGNVHVAEGVLVGVPAIGGVVFGTWLQQRVPERAVSLLFAALLLVTAALLAGAMIGALAIGFAAGAVAGMLGVGGGTLFVPALALLLGLAHVEAEATSLLAIVPVALVGAWRQHGYGNLRPRDALVIGLLAIPGAVAGVALANVLPERALRLGFAGLLVVVAVGLVRR